MEDLPAFPYHPDPLDTGSVERSERTCACCGRARGYIYVGPFYAVNELQDELCPWCIADGGAARKFDGTFVDEDQFAGLPVSSSVVNAVCRHTPSYVAWQQEQWLSHCNDGCEYHGIASEADVASADVITKRDWLRRYDLSETDWTQFTASYRPGGEVAFYKFVCRHCRVMLLAFDLA